jgi:hypothetical protein
MFETDTTEKKKFHFSECELVEFEAPDWWNAEGTSAPTTHVSFFRDPNGTRITSFNIEGEAVYSDSDLSIDDPFDQRSNTPPPEPVYAVDSADESIVEPSYQTTAEIKAAHNIVKAVEIVQVDVNKDSRIYKEAKSLFELFTKNSGIFSMKISTDSIKFESEADVDIGNDFFMVPGIGSIVLALVKAIRFFGTSASAPTKLSLLRTRIDDYQSKFRILQLQHRMNPTDDEEKLAERALSEKLLSDKINNLKMEVESRMNCSAKKTAPDEKVEVVSCRRLLKMICKRNSDSTKFMSALRELCKSNAIVAQEEIKHTDAVFHIRASKITKGEAEKLKKKEISTPVPETPVKAPIAIVSTPPPAPRKQVTTPSTPPPRPHSTTTPPGAPRKPAHASRSDKLAALLAKK